MPGNRRRNANTVPLLSMAAWILVCLFVGGSGLAYVAMKSQLHASGVAIKGLEKEVADLTTQDEVVRARIAELSSTSALLQRYKNDKTKLNGLIDIPQDKLVFVGRPQPHPVESSRDLHQVANRETTQP